MALRGGPQLRARLKAIKVSFKPVGRAWADETVRLARPMVPVRTGKLRRSIRRRNANMKRATVVANYTAYFVDHGTKRHAIQPKSVSGSRRGGVGTASFLKFEAGGRTVFARKVFHPGTRGSHFRNRAANEALRRNPMAAEVIKAWNAAA